MALRLPHLLLAASLAATLPFAALADTQEKDSQGGTPTDAGFYQNATGANVAEIELSQLALKQGSSAKVKQFAQKMVDDHTKANEKLGSLRNGDKGYSTTTSPPPDAQKDIDALKLLNGKEFDRQYAKVMVAGHEKAVAMFEVEAEKGSNPAMKAFAKETLPTIKEHQKMAKALPK
jgi:putative membrane protein